MKIILMLVFCTFAIWIQTPMAEKDLVTQPTPPPSIYVGEQKGVGGNGTIVTIITVDGKRFLVNSNGGICPIN